ncbi:MAG: hypothetical protein M2R45_00262 [Verrucomicrobia subdivision 3 bacterium]|nr:hypothetical protein [Limisphaerales bacterium]MCS1412978.1 hypothetical protein [Limisphaerales bacterium]
MASPGQQAAGRVLSSVGDQSGGPQPLPETEASVPRKARSALNSASAQHHRTISTKISRSQNSLTAVPKSPRLDAGRQHGPRRTNRPKLPGAAKILIGLQTWIDKTMEESSFVPRSYPHKTPTLVTQQMPLPRNHQAAAPKASAFRAADARHVKGIGMRRPNPLSYAVLNNA